MEAAEAGMARDSIKYSPSGLLPVVGDKSNRYPNEILIPSTVDIRIGKKALIHSTRASSRSYSGLELLFPPLQFYGSSSHPPTGLPVPVPDPDPEPKAVPKKTSDQVAVSVPCPVPAGP